MPDLMKLIEPFLAHSSGVVFNILLGDPKHALMAVHLGETQTCGPIEGMPKARHFFVRWACGEAVGLAVCGDDLRAAFIPGNDPAFDILKPLIEGQEFEDWKGNAQALEIAARC